MTPVLTWMSILLALFFAVAITSLTLRVKLANIRNAWVHADDRTLSMVYLIDKEKPIKKWNRIFKVLVQVMFVIVAVFGYFSWNQITEFIASIPGSI